MPVSVARQIAFDILYRVAAEGAYASELLFTRLGPTVSRADAALATELTLGVLRWQGLLDFLLARHLHRPSAHEDFENTVERLDLEVLLALRLGLYQLRFLERVPAHAAVGEAVELAKRSRKRSAAGLVNAVLRRVAEEAKVSGTDLEMLLPPEASVSRRAAIRHSHPEWLVARWISRFGSERTGQLLQANNRQPSLSCAVLDPENLAAVAASLRETYSPPGGARPSELPHLEDSARTDERETSPGRWLRSALTLGRGNAASLEAFRSGEISLQDEASQMVAHLADVRPGEQVLDVCSAPGGKTTLLARAVGPSGRVIAGDLHQHRLRSMREQLGRTKTSNVHLLAVDATQPLPFAGPFSRILVDAPCSGTGTLSRNPEIRWRLTPGDLESAHRRQVLMLRQALDLLASRGRLVYATCSLEPEENEKVVREVLAHIPSSGATFRISSGRAALTRHLREDVPVDALFGHASDCFFRTFPPETHTDGFFAAVIERE
jgi:16S rRNA (cytosine967-C5)-methyltransferase